MVRCNSVGTPPNTVHSPLLPPSAVGQNPLANSENIARLKCRTSPSSQDKSGSRSTSAGNTSSRSGKFPATLLSPTPLASAGHETSGTTTAPPCQCHPATSFLRGLLTPAGFRCNQSSSLGLMRTLLRGRRMRVSLRARRGSCWRRVHILSQADIRGSEPVIALHRRRPTRDIQLQVFSTRRPLLQGPFENPVYPIHPRDRFQPE